MAGRGTDIKLDDDARAAGGLKIIGTERHESRRIDNQLRGRSGRQGDVGESQFFISLEDDLMGLFGSDKLMDVFNALGVPENEQIQHKMLTSAIEKAQQKIEANNYGIRKNLLEYDQVMNDQREIIYKERLRVLNGESMRENNTDTMELQVEVRPDFYSDEINRMLALKKKLAGRLQSVLGLGVNVKLVEPRSIERSVGKAKRVIDNRKL